jgi:hypothetical protein
VRSDAKEFYNSRPRYPIIMGSRLATPTADRPINDNGNNNDEIPRQNQQFLGVAATRGWISEAIMMAIAVPLKFLYFRGPSLDGYGFWESLPPEEICTRLTNVDAHFWVSSESARAACDGLIERKFDAFMVGCLGIACAMGFTVVLVQLACRCIIVRPIVKAIERNKRHHHRHHGEEDTDT